MTLLLFFKATLIFHFKSSHFIANLMGMPLPKDDEENQE